MKLIKGAFFTQNSSSLFFYPPGRTCGNTGGMSPFNRLLLVIKQTAFDAYTAQERMARAAGRVLTYDNLRMGRLKERHDTHMFQVERITKMLQERGVRRGKGKNLKT